MTMINRRMPAKKPHTHRAYCVVREGRRGAGRWVETGFATVADNGKGYKLYLPLVPVTGFDGHILLEPIDASPEAPLLDPDEDDEDDMPPADYDDTPAVH